MRLKFFIFLVSTFLILFSYQNCAEIGFQKMESIACDTKNEIGACGVESFDLLGVYSAGQDYQEDYYKLHGANYNFILKVYDKIGFDKIAVDIQSLSPDSEWQGCYQEFIFNNNADITKVNSEIKDLHIDECMIAEDQASVQIFGFDSEDKIHGNGEVYTIDLDLINIRRVGGSRTKDNEIHETRLLSIYYSDMPQGIDEAYVEIYNFKQDKITCSASFKNLRYVGNSSFRFSGSSDGFVDCPLNAADHKAIIHGYNNDELIYKHVHDFKVIPSPIEILKVGIQSGNCGGEGEKAYGKGFECTDISRFYAIVDFKDYDISQQGAKLEFTTLSLVFSGVRTSYSGLNPTLIQDNIYKIHNIVPPGGGSSNMSGVIPINGYLYFDGEDIPVFFKQFWFYVGNYYNPAHESLLSPHY